MLQAISTRTGGQFFRATNTNSVREAFAARSTARKGRIRRASAHDQ